MKKTTLSTFLGVILMSLTLSISQASALSFPFSAQDDSSVSVEKFIASLFQSSSKTGAALIGEVTSISFLSSSSTWTASTTAPSLVLFSKQKSYSIGVSAETKVRKLGLPATLDDVKAGDKVSIVSSISKTETPKLRAKVISILSQENEGKYKIATTTADVATSTESANASSSIENEKQKDEKLEKAEKDQMKDTVKEDKLDEKPLPKIDYSKKFVK